MKKNIKIIVSVIVIIAVEIGIFFGQKEYYRRKAIENTRFIKYVQEYKLPAINSATYKEIFEKELTNPVWTQSKVKGDKYVVICKGRFANNDVVIERYIKESPDKQINFYNKSGEKNIRVIYNNKSVNGPFALGILFAYYDQVNNLNITEFSDLMKFNKLLQEYTDYNMYNLDEDEFNKSITKLDSVTKNMNVDEQIKFIRKINSLNISDLDLSDNSNDNTKEKQEDQNTQQQKENTEINQNTNQEKDNQIDQQQQQEEIEKYNQTGELSPED